MKKEFVVNRQGRDFVLYAGLLDQAHSEGLKRIQTQLLQAPTKENEYLAIVFAEVETAKGIFTGIGDASPANVGRMIAPHITRMAETRAKARALRDAINVGTTALEELGDLDDEPAPERPATPAFGTELPRTPGAMPGATNQQLTKLGSLYKALGRREAVPANLSSDDASRLIVTLAEEFNSQHSPTRS